MSMTGKQYLTLRNTVRVLRLSGAPLTAQQEADVRKYESAIRQFEENKLGQYRSVAQEGAE